MKLRRLGGTNLQASEIALGTVELGLDYGIPGHGEHTRPSEPEAIRLLNEALDLGVTFIDTARIYGNSEEIIGKALKYRRGEYILATKIGPFDACDLESPTLRDRVWKSVETSMRMLETDYVDLLMIHSASVEVIRKADELLETLHAMQQQGKVRYVGASVYEEAGPEALRRDEFQCLQVPYNALDRLAEKTILPAASEEGVGIVARSVLLKGAITSRYRELPDDLSELKAAAASLERLADASGMSLPEMAFRYVLSSDLIALCGTARREELRSAIQAANRGPLDAELIAQIQKVVVVDRRLLNPGNWQIP
jgi:aryl-alcohol dehydrogenase-like predicted oxidoreductase